MNLSDLSQEDIDLIQRSEGKGFTYEKLNSWGVPTPPQKGWRSKLLKDLGLERIRDGKYQVTRDLWVCKNCEFVHVSDDEPISCDCSHEKPKFIKTQCSYWIEPLMQITKENQ